MRLTNITVEINSFRDESRTFNQAQLEVKLTETSLNREYVFSMPNFLDQLEHRIEKAIVINFPESKAAEAVRLKEGLDRVTLNPDMLDHPMTSIHTAMRKVGDTPASTFWHRLINTMPGILVDWLDQASKRELEKLEGPVQAQKVSRVVRDSWEEVLNNARRIGRLTNFSERDAKDSGFDYEELYDMTVRQLDQLNDVSISALTSLDYLSKQDWLCFTFDLVQWPESSSDDQSID